MFAASPPYREGTELPRTKVGICYNLGGLGDWINWTTAVQYAIESNPHTYGYVVTQKHFADLAHLWLDQYAPRFTVLTVETDDFRKVKELDDCYLICPAGGQYANTCGVNIFRLGFIYYNQTERIPPNWNHLPRVRGDEADLTRFNLPESYAVITPYATADNKRLKARAINELVDGLLLEGITPAFIGKRDVAPDHKGIGDSGIEYGKGIDLRDNTTLREAACIMARSRFTFGLDNGLLHLAACSDTTIIWALTTVRPDMTIPPRKGRTLVLTPPESLSCRFCQNNMRYLTGHSFKNCLYGDNLCTETYNGELLIKAAGKVLHGN